MRHTKLALVALAGVGMSGAAMAVSNGDIVFTEAPSDRVMLLASDGSSLTTLYQFSDPNDDAVRLAGITRARGKWYVNSGFGFPSFPSEAAVFQLDNLFSNSTVESTFASSDPLRNPIGLSFHAKSNTLLSINNEAQSAMNPNEQDGVIGISVPGAAVSTVFDEDVQSNTFPRYQAGNQITRSAANKNDFYISNINGGVVQGAGDDGKGSTIHRLSMNPDGTGSMSLVIDLSNVLGGLNNIRGITSVVGGDGELDIFFADRFTDAIYRLDEESNNVTQIISGLTDPGGLIYNQYTNKLVFGENGDTISHMNLDGTGVQLLASGVASRGFYIVPAPGAAALFGLAGVAGMRRRR